MERIQLVLKDKNNGNLKVDVVKANGRIFESIIPLSKLSGFRFNERVIDEDGLPSVGMELPGVLKEDGITVYLDRSNTLFWQYDGTKTLYYLPKTDKPDDVYFYIQRLLELNRIGGLTPETTEELLSLCKDNKYEEMKHRLNEVCGLFSYIFDDESYVLERKSSLAHPAGYNLQGFNKELRDKQMDELFQTIVGAANAKNDKDFHLVIGMTDDGDLTDNVLKDINIYWNGKEKQFIDDFMNRIGQMINAEFAAKIRLNFITIKEHRILDVVVPKWEGQILYFKNKPFLRVNASTRILEGIEFENFVLNSNNRLYN